MTTRGSGFGAIRYKQGWPFAGTSQATDAPWCVVLKVSGSGVEGDLWNDVVARFKDRLVVIVSADDLRRRDVRIGRGLSWEATAGDLSAELRGNPLVKPLTDACHLIVTFGSDGAYWLDNHGALPRAMLVFDAARPEGEWATEQGKGSAVGLLSCFTAAVVRGLCLTERKKSDEPAMAVDFEDALVAGLHATRECLRLGHGTVYVEQDGDKHSGKQQTINSKFGFQLDAIAASICEPKGAFVSAVLPRAIDARDDWMMLDEWHLHARKDDRLRPHFEAALAVAVLGPGALERFPVARLGDLQTVDRREIEGLRTISQLVDAYERGGAQKKPLNIGVFGPPGAGKSFGVTQIAKAVLGIDKDDILVFNLSQFNNPPDLIGALHQVRDEALSGRTPVVFWDEFDSHEYKWLQYLLAPMQDGAFQEGQITHPIGKSVFVFAGATSATFDAFGPRDPRDVDHEELHNLPDPAAQRRHIEQQWLDFVLKKGPDFKSRLVAYLDVLGPNPRRFWKREAGGRAWADDPADLCFPIRRALFIRSHSKLKNPDSPLGLDRGVLEALLEIPEDKSGARSLEDPCKHLRQHATGTPTRSNLPGPQLLDLHVDSAAFWSICERDADFVAAAPTLARGLHEDWLKTLNEDDRKKNRNAKPWEELTDDTRASNVAQASRIPRILALAGLRVVRGEPLSPVQEEDVRQTLLKHAEVLAEAEHNYWMVERNLSGWKYRKQRMDDKKHHDWLVPYAQLPHIQKQKDLRVVKGQPEGDTPEVKDYINRVKRIGFRVEHIPDPGGPVRLR